MVRGLATSFCANASELLFGISPKRLAYLAYVDGNTAARSRINEWTGFQRERLNGWMTEPEMQLKADDPEAAAASSAVDVLGWVGLGEMRARMKYCAAMWGENPNLVWFD